MRNLFKLFSLFIILLFLTAAVNNCYAQHKKAKVHRSLRDSLRRAVLKRDSLLRTFKHSDNSLNELLQKIEYYNSSYNQDFSDFSQGFDTLEESQKLPPMEKRMKVMANLIQKDNSSSLGYLFTIRDIMGHFKDDLDNWQSDLADDNTKLDKIFRDGDEFKADTSMHTIPADSTLRVQYLSQIAGIQSQWAGLNKGVQKSLIKIGLLQNRVTALDLLMLDINDRIDLKIHDFAIRSLTNEYGFIWENNKENLTPFDTVASKTSRLNSRLLTYFFEPASTSHQNFISDIAVLLVLVAFFVWVLASRRKLARLKAGNQDTLNETRYTGRYSFVSSLLIASVLGLYFYNQPPSAFIEILLLLLMVCIGILTKPVWPKPFFKLWISLFILAIFYAITNLFIKVSFEDRIFLLFLSVASIVTALIFLKTSRTSPENYPPHSQLFIKLFVGLQAVSFILNIVGRFSIAKIIGVASVFDLCLGFGFYLLIQILMEGLFLQLEANKNAGSGFSSYLDFKILQNKFKNVLVLIASVLWFINLFENLDVKDYLFETAGGFLNHPYMVGKETLTFGSLVIFVFVLWLSIIISRVIIYFYDFAEQQTTVTNDIKKTKTSILLIRLSVFAIGFITAITVSGIPLSEVTIVIGALGVGIGFGLQNIVNNLVSGVILAFEKPVQVGDIIEVGGQAGTITDIGIRASKIATGNGSEVIIPNGDLISQHVTNWTLTNKNRQIELIIGVAYGSDIAKVEEILKKIIRGRTDIMPVPQPNVFVHNFSDTSVDFRLLFWASDISKWVSLKSNVMIEIYNEFAKEGIKKV